MMCSSFIYVSLQLHAEDLSVHALKETQVHTPTPSEMLALETLMIDQSSHIAGMRQIEETISAATPGFDIAKSKHANHHESQTPVLIAQVDDEDVNFDDYQLETIPEREAIEVIPNEKNDTSTIESEVPSNDNDINTANEEVTIPPINDAVSMEEMTVTGEQGVQPGEPASKLDRDELARELGSTLGETLQNQAGVHNATFGPGVGLPVIRGMSGSRVQILHGAMGTFDASSVSPDHAATIEPMLAEDIQVYRGPASFRYSGTAMGGAVDVNTGRIPEYLPENGLEGSVETRYDSNPALRAGVFKIDASKGPLVIHFDGYERKSNDIQIPGNALDEPAVLEQFGNLIEFDNTDGFVANSDTESSGFSIGSSIVFDKGFAGIAVNKLDNNYGIPPGGLPPHSDDPANVLPTPENLRIDMEQTRWDAAAAIYDVILGIDSISLKVGNVDYEHSELARGLPSTSYDSQATEARLEMEFTHNPAMQGVAGYQWSEQLFGAIGIESFIPPSDITRKSIFLIETLDLDRVGFEVALRHESSEIKPVEDSRIINGSATPVPLPDFDDTARSISGAIRFDLTDALGLRASLTKAQRTPAVQEYLSLGPHFATRSYEIGNTLLEVEKASNLDLGLYYQTEQLDFNLNVFRNDVENYIYQENLGIFYDIETRFFQAGCAQITDCVPVFGYFQQDAMFLGYEAELRFRPPIVKGFVTELGMFSDYVRGYFVTEGAGDVPRLPPRRAGLFLDGQWRDFNVNARWTHAFAQNRAGVNETTSDGYDRFDLALTYRRKLDPGNELMFFIKGKNLTDDEIRHSTSFLRSFTPEPGQSFEIGLRWNF